MNYKLDDKQQCVLHYISKPLKWWEKILQKLHIKNYYKPIVGIGKLTYRGDSND